MNKLYVGFTKTVEVSEMRLKERCGAAQQALDEG
jgi:hypothetical protein